TISGAVISALFAAPAYGADGAGSVAYTLSATNGAQTGLWLTGESAPGDEIILVKVSDTEYQGVAGGAGGTPAFTISIDGATGAVTVTQHETLEHTVDGADHDDALALSGAAAISVVQTVTDGDGDTASATSANALGITFEDDGPKAEAVAGATASVLLDESDGTGSGADGVNPGTITGATIEGLFAAPAFGADGAGSVAYTLSANDGAQTGLWLTGESAPGDEIILVKVSDTEYQGVAGGAGGTLAFTISIDGGTGAVTVTQHETLEHTVDGADHDDVLALSGNAAISVVQTVTDGDGDTASATSANALGITFEDDGPKAEAVAGATASVLLDESDGTGSGVDGINPGTISGAVISALFAAPAYGADGSGSVAYTLSATNGAQTGLWLTGESAPGDEIILVKVSDTEYQGVAGGAGGTLAFTISTDGGTGAVTVTQHETLEHTVDGAAHDDALALSGNAAISVVQTVTDGDGDTASATSANALGITFEDDGPKAEAVAGATASVLLDESDGTGSGADGINPGTISGATIEGLFAAPAYGADGSGSVAYTLSATNGAQTGLWLTGESAPGDEIILVKVSDTEYQGVAGGAGGTLAFTISIDGATGAVTVTQHETLEHTTDGGPGADHDDALALSGAAAISVVQTVADGDGDTASATSANALGITFEDDGPKAEAVADATASVLLDESDGTGSGADGVNPGTISGAVISALFAAPAYGADGAGSVAYTLSATNGAQTGLWLTGESGAGDEIILVKVSDTEYQGVAGGAGGTPAFTISIDGGTGAVTVTQHETLEHTVDGADHDDALALSGNAAISVVQTVTDGDGDTASATSANALGITFEDDGPKAEAVAGATASVLLDESDGTGSGVDGINPGTISGAVISALFAAPAYGADGSGSVAYTLSATNGAQTGLWLTGESAPGDEIILVKVSDTEYQGVAGGAGGTPAFTISIDGATGAVTVTQHETLEHTTDGGSGAAHDDALALSGAAAISVVQTVTDGDGDTASATSANALGITFEDDGPKAEAVAGATASVLLDESDGTGSGADGINPGTISGAVISGLFAAPAYGADGAGSVAYTLSATDGAQTGLWLTGESGAGDEIILVKVSDTEYQGVAGGAGGTPAFTISIDGATGAVTVTQHETLEHTTDGGPGADHDDALALSGTAAISVVQTVTDGD
ncbi:MAG: DUF5801 domain-containing protein, partial [Nitratireductor sp.]|uniref:DUF5801 repeats-in-toxin domain-containing protein n=1 Tax=Nitratireductor sp. TaxID=1872084 RepID=UPI002633DA91